MFPVQVIQGGDLEFDALVYPTQHQNTMQFIQNSLSSLPNMLHEQASHLYDIARQQYERFYGMQAQMRVANALSAASNIRQENVIYPVKTIQECMQATIAMQRWIMAEPSIRELYHRQACDGYADTYVDVEPGLIGESHYDYRRAMTGIVRYDQDDIVAKYYMDELRSGDRELTPVERLMIQESWETVKIAVSQMNEDPTNPYGGKL